MSMMPNNAPPASSLSPLKLPCYLVICTAVRSTCRGKSMYMASACHAPPPVRSPEYRTTTCSIGEQAREVQIINDRPLFCSVLFPLSPIPSFCLLFFLSPLPTPGSLLRGGPFQKKSKKMSRQREGGEIERNRGRGQKKKKAKGER
ncbi:hypothetical protein H112_08141 [Trichophyton rubrum D6]|uniref:Uncharacterized protein n=2 Tax=Trichophyton TaxID=5550 RepID=A0A080WIB8_TRIRC|nr:uncharacterized protein TERG_11615 [Trichophyton rubrum CBS 118892]EZF10617.1 hypothetical protein H100_08168 [Trichophyton rubrum MR850]EZF37475.1 hypothetical protein H102_08125 [Trichophyton rubrum CBS 100081]EZF69379.1 hypothetical protein H105_08152 [Trichophyton soudanense CBS 452.61]EZG02002.1 hypothetical protein H106_08022 [Trichophyton rubrum CBS 735.88]EZG12275.1 hypothetical protein H107_08293 [Trichophyton rubrum CBS 202.88]KDB29236.1 hypothetical protein H112_08141 [Trichophy